MRKVVTRSWFGLLAIGAVAFAASHASATVVDFDDLTLSPESHWNGPDPSGTSEPGPWGTTQVIGSFDSGGVPFVNRYNVDWASWTGFAYSNTTDVTTSGSGNQYSAFTGTGAGSGNDNYGVAFGSVVSTAPTLTQLMDDLPYFEIPDGMSVQNAYVTNTTYAALSMLSGDAYAKKFGGDTGDDPDWFKLTVYGTDASGDKIAAEVEFYLADFRFTDNALDYVVDQWSLVDLSALADAKRVYFNLTSTDNGAYGMNTPGFFAIDDVGIVPVPEPSTLALLAGAGLCFAAASLRRRKPPRPRR